MELDAEGEDPAGFDIQEFLKKEPLDISFSDEPNTAVEDDIVSDEMKEEESEVGFEEKEDAELDAEGEDPADFDIQEFLKKEPLNISFSDEPNTAVEDDVVLDEMKGEGLEEVRSEEKEDLGLEVEEEDSSDFDLQEFLRGGPAGDLSSGESAATVDEDVVLHEMKEQESEEKEDVKLEEKEPTASLGAIDKSVLELEEEGSNDFDIQDFLEELGNLPSEKDLRSEK